MGPVTVRAARAIRNQPLDDFESYVFPHASLRKVHSACRGPRRGTIQLAVRLRHPWLDHHGQLEPQRHSSIVRLGVFAVKIDGRCTHPHNGLLRLSDLKIPPGWRNMRPPNSSWICGEAPGPRCSLLPRLHHSLTHRCPGAARAAQLGPLGPVGVLLLARAARARAGRA